MRRQHGPRQPRKLSCSCIKILVKIKPTIVRNRGAGKFCERGVTLALEQHRLGSGEEVLRSYMSWAIKKKNSFF